MPVEWSLRVRIASTPCKAAASATRASSVAITTRLAPLSRARSATRTTIGRPPMSASALPGSRDDA